MMNPHKAVGSVSLSAFLLQAGAGEQVHCSPARGPPQLPGAGLVQRARFPSVSLPRSVGEVGERHRPLLTFGNTSLGPVTEAVSQLCL